MESLQIVLDQGILPGIDNCVPTLLSWSVERVYIGGKSYLLVSDKIFCEASLVHLISKFTFYQFSILILLKTGCHLSAQVP